MKKLLSNKVVQLALVVAAAALLSGVLYLVTTEEYKDWQPVQGTVTDLTQYYRGGRLGRGRLYRIDYTYIVNGTEYRGTDSFSGSIPDSLTIGTQAQVWYDPHHPARSLFARPLPSLAVYVPFIFAVPVSLFVVSGGFNRKKRSLRS